MPKVSTEDCKRAIAAAWPADFGEGAENFKRVSKKGKKGEPIVRVFYHRTLPVQAIVVEENDSIVSTTFKGLQFFDLIAGSDPEGELEDSLQGEEATKFLVKHKLYQPSDFYFFVSDELDPHQVEFPHWFVLVPVSFFDREGYMYDCEIGYLVDPFLPDDCGESSSCSFSASAESTPDILRKKLAEAGFARSEKFDTFMKR